MMDGVLGKVDEDQSIAEEAQEQAMRIMESVRMASTPKIDYNPIIDNKVSHPNHYRSKSGLECKNVLNAATEELKGYEAVWTGNAIKYLWRWKKKGGDEDLRKAIECIKFILDEHLKEEQ